MKIFNVEYLITEHENGSKRGTRYKDNLNVVARDAIDAGRKVEEKLLASAEKVVLEGKTFKLTYSNYEARNITLLAEA